MNLFVVAWNASGLDSGRLRSELRVLATYYPHVDSDTLAVFQSADGTVISASLGASPDAVAPRSYVDTDRGHTTLYAGLPVDPLKQCAAHRADDLRTRWDQVRERLEGTYAVVHVNADPPALEIQTDLLGGEPVYYTRHGESGWLISNSVLLLERLTHYRSLDRLGTSMYLHLGHVVGGRTLRAGIRVIPGGQRWTWTARDAEPAKTEYYPLSRLGRLPRRPISKPFLAELGRALQRPLASLAAHFDTLVCPLTGGKDSRVIASLLLDAGIDAAYFTFGDDEGVDARIAAAIAARFGLTHEIKAIGDDDVLTDWDSSCLQNVRLTDGMRSLYLLAGLSKTQPLHGDRQDIYFWGACGEIARGYFGDRLLTKRDLALDDVKEFMRSIGPGDPCGLVLPEAVAMARSFRHRYIDYCADQGIRLEDIPDVWGTHAVDARRIGNNGRGLAGTRDTHAPFASRAFFEASLSIPALQRCTEPLHFGLTRQLVPRLHRMPLAGSAWRAQNAMVNLGLQRIRRRWTRLRAALPRAQPQYHYVDPMFDRLGWFEAKREDIRERALDSRCAAIWEFVDRGRFAEIMSPGTHESVRSRSLQLLYHVATLAYYESDPERRSAGAGEWAETDAV